MLLICEMLGERITAGHIHAVKLASSTDLGDKRLGMHMCG